MNKIIPTLVCLALTGCVNTGGIAFVLKDKKTGTESGPFWLRDGNTITVGTESASIHKVLRTNDILIQKLKSHVIPEIDFREADIRDIIGFFREPRVIASQQEEITDPPVNIVLVLPAGKTPTDMRIPLVTWQARSLSVYDALRTLAKMTDMDFEVRDDHVWLTKMK